MKISDKGALAAMRELLPHFLVAGRLACRIQDDIAKNGNHNGDAKTGDRFTEVLTDADVIIETYLGTIILDTFEDAAFHGEEYERDRVSGYFPKDAPFLITLDPVDGTLYFRDGLPVFSIILTVCSGGKIAGSVIYLPREERFYLASDAEGAFTTTAADVAGGKPPVPFALPGGGRTVIIGNKDLGIEDALKAEGFEVMNANRDYDGAPGWRRSSLQLFTGGVVGMIVSNAQLIDAAAIAYVAARAGGSVNTTAFDPASLRVPTLVAATDGDVYEKLRRIAGA